MLTRRTLYPAQAGSKKWLKKYGERLVCVRYKYDPDLGRRMITVELVEEETSWQRNQNYTPKNKIVNLRIDYGEVDLAMKVKSYGAKWDRSKKVWKISYGAVQALRLEGRIVPHDEGTNKDDKLFEKPP